MKKFNMRKRPIELGEYLIEVEHPTNRYFLVSLQYNKVTHANEFYYKDYIIPPRQIVAYYKIKPFNNHLIRLIGRVVLVIVLAVSLLANCLFVYSFVSLKELLCF